VRKGNGNRVGYIKSWVVDWENDRRPGLLFGYNWIWARVK
jgi:hypothetical protein